ncbi:MAG: hypothetical protein WC607_02675 [Candidatus Micrarchaeia archaeon]
MKNFFLVVACALLAAGCISSQVDYCLGGVCSNASINVTASVPALPSPSPLPSPQPAPLLEAICGVDSVNLGDSFSFSVDYSFGSGSEELGYAEIKVFEDGVEFASLEPANNNEPVSLDYTMLGKTVGEHVYSVNASSFYLNGSLYRTQSTSFGITVKPLGYYQNEALNHSVNASSKAAQSFTLASPVQLGKLSVYGQKNADAAIQIELCEDWDGLPGRTLLNNYQDDSGVPSEPAWYSIEFDTTLEPGTYWIVVTTMGGFDWFQDIYAQNADSGSLYRYGGDWISGEGDKFYAVSN